MYQGDTGPIFNDIQRSGFINKIEQLIKDKIEEEKEQIRSSSRRCLDNIQSCGDTSVQSELVSIGYARVFTFAFSTASGSGEEEDYEIYYRLSQISQFFSNLNKRRNNLATFPPQPLLAHRSDEQIEEEGANEEIDSQLINNGIVFGIQIKNEARQVK
ncbi:MAG: hypothetical protein EZS28_001592 [Streblomastix strix]|uniref:Uncharacterized protein n=1 Tax=Streblomastix strix TaxID=222440 RepID=A0A5J4X6P7_9EUKA|nr:MAG: hypothetical protein EZS28_001592 [Streblomastix strix]